MKWTLLGLFFIFALPIVTIVGLNTQGSTRIFILTVSVLLTIFVTYYCRKRAWKELFGFKNKEQIKRFRQFIKHQSMG